MNSGKKVICAKVGKISASIVRQTIFLARKAGKLGDFVSEAAKGLVTECKTLLSKLSRLRKRDRPMARLTQLEEKEKIDFIKLGKEVFSKKSEKPEYIFEAGNIKEILTEIKEIEVDKRKIQEKLEDQKRKEEEAKIIKRAVKNLNSPNYRTRLVALQVLGRVSAKETIPEVQKMLEDPSQEVRTQAAEVLKLLTRNIVSSQQSDISSSQPMAEQENRDKGK